jgi:hypothetical protein
VGGKVSIMIAIFLCEKCGEETHPTMESRLYPKHCLDCEDDKQITALLDELTNVVKREWDPGNRIENLKEVIDYARRELD